MADNEIDPEAYFTPGDYARISNDPEGVIRDFLYRIGEEGWEPDEYHEQMLDLAARIHVAAGLRSRGIDSETSVEIAFREGQIRFSLDPDGDLTVGIDFDESENDEDDSVTIASTNRINGVSHSGEEE